MIRIKEALAVYNSKNKDNPLSQADLGAFLWPKSTIATQRMNIWKLSNGETKRINPEWVTVLCDKLKTTPNFLFKEV